MKTRLLCSNVPDSKKKMVLLTDFYGALVNKLKIEIKDKICIKKNIFLTFKKYNTPFFR